MTDVLLARPQGRHHKVDYFSDAALARVKRRYRAEARFRLYGLSAVILAATFVIILLADIVANGLPAFFEHRINLMIDLDAAAIDPTGKRDIATLREADYQGLVAQNLHAAFPGATDRRARRQLEGLVSTGAGDDLRARVLGEPALIGQKIAFSALLSDNADLYFKGAITEMVKMPGVGTITIMPAEGTVELTGREGAFAAMLGGVKRRLREIALATEAELARLPPSEAGADNAALDLQRAALKDRIADLGRRAEDAAGAETIDPATMPSQLIIANGATIRLETIGATRSIGTILVASPVAVGTAAQWEHVTYLTPEGNRRLADGEIARLEAMRARGMVEKGFATRFFVNGDSGKPELAGIRGALIGSALTLSITLLLCLPIGVGAAVYLEEFAPKNRLTDVLEVNINNLAAVPSIVFGLLGLAMFLNFFGLPRSSPLVGGLVLALLVLPTIIIAARAALKAVPPSIKEAALGVGASHQQAVLHHILPLAMPGIMTGTIIGMAHALGETAPLLMIGMVAFIVDIPTMITDAASVLPVQIFLWADEAKIAFKPKTAAAIMVLLAFLFAMNGAAILLRRRFERRW